MTVYVTLGMRVLQVGVPSLENGDLVRRSRLTFGDIQDPAAALLTLGMRVLQVGAPARVGLVAPNAVTIPAGGTGLDPSQTSFFQVRSSRHLHAGLGLCVWSHCGSRF